MMLFLRCCPRCKGDIYVDKDAYGHFVKCLQCGYSRDLPDLARRASADEGGEPEAVGVRPAGVAEERLSRAS